VALGKRGALSFIQCRLLRELTLPGAHLSAASGLVRIGEAIHVVADDELHLASFTLGATAPGRLLRLFKGQLPIEAEARKAAKPDLEALCALPAFDGHPFGALLALGSASKKQRHRAALLTLDANGSAQGKRRVIDLQPLLAPLRARWLQLNIEGAFLSGGALCLLQRGNDEPRVNACIRFDWPALQPWLRGRGPAPAPLSVSEYELGAIGTVPLGFTDGAALADGGWLFSAAAEDTSDSYTDGPCLGSCIGRVDASGRLRWLRRLALSCKVEGIAAELRGNALDLLMVTDADDRRRPALLLRATVLA